jgi:hypothetical protein
MGRPRSNNRDLPLRVFHRHGAYYYVIQNKWHNLGRDREYAIQRAAEMDKVPVGDARHLERFLRKKLTLLKARPQARTGRLKAVLIDAEQVIESARRLEWRCAVTGLPMTLEVVRGKRPYAPSIDRIDCALDYVPGNVRIVCVAANLAMNVWGEEVLLRMMRGIVPRRRLLDRASNMDIDTDTEAA